MAAMVVIREGLYAGNIQIIHILAGVMEMRYTERLSRLILIGIYVGIAYLILHFFGSVAGYIALSLVVALIAKPLMVLLRKIKIRGKSAPDTLLAIVTILIILSAIIALIGGVIPVIKNVVLNISSISNEENLNEFSSSMAGLNAVLRETLKLEPGFKIEVMVLDQMTSLLNFNAVSNIIGSVASSIAGLGVGLFSVVFIAFFLIKDETLFTRLINAITPDNLIDHVSDTMRDVQHLLSRYFVGLLIEIVCVSFIDVSGLWLIGKLDFNTALGIGVMAGLLNIIPYLGPLFGGIGGSIMAIVIKYCSTEAVGMDMGFWTFVAIVAAVFLFAQLVDNVVLQPFIYSTSVNAHPLEIFIVMLLAGVVGGIIGMIIAIPVYTVARVTVINFFPDSKAVKSLFT